jgi:hypothetical protein
MNLNISKAKYEAFADYLFIDADSVKNPEDLLRPNPEGTTFIWTKGNNPNPVREMAKPAIKPDNYRMPEILESDAFYTT